MGRLERHLDLDLIARLKAGIRHKAKPYTRVRPLRDAGTYRAARRNAVRDERARELAAKRQGANP